MIKGLNSSEKNPCRIYRETFCSCRDQGILACLDLRNTVIDLNFPHVLVTVHHRYFMMHVSGVEAFSGQESHDEHASSLKFVTVTCTVSGLLSSSDGPVCFLSSNSWYFLEISVCSSGNFMFSNFHVGYLPTYLSSFHALKALLASMPFLFWQILSFSILFFSPNTAVLSAYFYGWVDWKVAGL